MSLASDKGMGTGCEFCTWKKEIKVLTEGKVRLRSEGIKMQNSDHESLNLGYDTFFHQESTGT